VEVEIGSWLRERFDGGRGRLVLEEEIGEGWVLMDLLDQLAAEFEAFAEVVFDRRRQRLHSHIRVVINGHLLRSLRELDIELKDGDRIAFFPAYAGG